MRLNSPTRPATQGAHRLCFSFTAPVSLPNVTLHECSSRLHAPLLSGTFRNVLPRLYHLTRLLTKPLLVFTFTTSATSWRLRALIYIPFASLRPCHPAVLASLSGRNSRNIPAPEGRRLQAIVLAREVRRITPSLRADRPGYTCDALQLIHRHTATVDVRKLPDAPMFSPKKEKRTDPGSINPRPRLRAPPASGL